MYKKFYHNKAKPHSSKDGGAANLFGPRLALSKVPYTLVADSLLSYWSVGRNQQSLTWTVSLVLTSYSGENQHRTPTQLGTREQDPLSIHEGYYQCL